MKYLCLIYAEEGKLTTLPGGEREAIADECLAYSATLDESGHLIASERLEPIEAATTVRVREGKMAVVDGPYAETKEQLGGFYLIEARDLNEAIRIAARIPPARLGSVEVRPVREHRARRAS